MTTPDRDKPYRSARLAGWLAPKQMSSSAIIETLLLVLLTLLIGWWLNPQDPFMVHTSFPWLWLAPLLLTLRYGTPIALLSSGLLLGLWLLLRLMQFLPEGFPSTFFLGGLIVTLVTGEFSDIWSSRLRRVASVNTHLDQTLSALTQRHYLLHLAYTRLEQEMLVKPVTLRDALQRLRRLVVDQGDTTALPKSQDFLNLLGEACRLTEASLHVFHNNKFQIEPVAQLGITGQLDMDDPLVRYALEQRKVSHVQSSIGQTDKSRYVIVGPVYSSDEVLLGLLTVSNLPFLSLNEETLRFVSVLLGYYADAIQLGASIQPILQRQPDCRLLFAGELTRLHRIYQEVGIGSLIAACIVAPGPRQLDIKNELLRQARGADMEWELQLGDSFCVLTLMPLSNSAAFTGYIQRCERWLHDGFGFNDLHSAGVTLLSTQIGSKEPAELLHDVVQLCHAESTQLTATTSREKDA